VVFVGRGLAARSALAVALLMNADSEINRASRNELAAVHGQDAYYDSDALVAGASGCGPRPMAGIAIGSMVSRCWCSSHSLQPAEGNYLSLAQLPSHDAGHSARLIQSRQLAHSRRPAHH
jgi:hypothetical protein